MNKKIILAASLLMAVTSLTGCKKNKGDIGARDGAATLNITYARMGYGDKWLKAICEKYNEITGVGFNFSSRVGQDGVTAIDTEINSKKSNADIIFTKRGDFARDIYAGKTKIGDTSYDCIYADISDVYNSKYEGESKTIKEKMLPQYEDFYNFDGKYYGLPWANGLMGIVRNLRVWDSYGFTDANIPLTTDELLDLSNTIQTTGNKKAAWLYSFQDEYYTPIANVFVAQYEGKEVMDKYFLQGKDPTGKISKNFYSYNGQKETLDFMEELITKYQHPNSESMEFTLMQSSFLLDEAMFSINGSWLESEMGTSDRYADIDIIKFPVISALSDQLSFAGLADADSKLHDLVAYVDVHTTKGDFVGKPTFATDDDVERVREARQYAYLSSGCDHECFIPVYSSQIDAAKDFLKFFYSDVSLNIYHDVMGGTLPAEVSGGYSKVENASTFRASINAAIEEGHFYSQEPKAKFFSVGEVNYYFQNGSEGFTKAFVNKQTPDSVIVANNKYIEKNWTSIITKLGLN